MWRRYLPLARQFAFILIPPVSFFCAMIAAMTLRFLDPFGTGKLVLFQVTYDRVRVGPLLSENPPSDEPHN
jgi:hypothetical protein